MRLPDLLADLCRILRGLLHHGGHLAHGGRAFLQAGRLLLGAACKIVRGRADLGGAGQNVRGGGRGLRQKLAEPRSGIVEAGPQAVMVGIEGALDPIREIAALHLLQPGGDLGHDRVQAHFRAVAFCGIVAEHQHRTVHPADAILVFGKRERTFDIPGSKPLHADNGADIGVTDQLLGLEQEKRDTTHRGKRKARLASTRSRAKPARQPGRDRDRHQSQHQDYDPVEFLADRHVSVELVDHHEPVLRNVDEVACRSSTAIDKHWLTKRPLTWHPDGD